MTRVSSTSRNTLSARLSPKLAKEHNVRSMTIKKGDSVMIMRGIFRDIEGKVIRVDRDKVSIYVEGVTREKSDGSTIFVPIHPSKVMIAKLNLDDEWRKDILERKTKPILQAIEKPKAGMEKSEDKE